MEEQAVWDTQKEIPPSLLSGLDLIAQQRGGRAENMTQEQLPVIYF